jgi:hypothetical protein
MNRRKGVKKNRKTLRVDEKKAIFEKICENEQNLGNIKKSEEERNDK